MSGFAHLTLLSGRTVHVFGRQTMAALVAGAALTVIAACGSSPEAITVTTYAPIPTVATSAVATPTVGSDASSSAASAPNGPTHIWSTTDNGSDGAVWTTSFTAGPLVSGAAINGLEPTDLSLVAGCQVDAQRDAVIPWVLHTQSTTGNFTITTQARLELTDRLLALGDNPAGPNEAVEYAANFSDDTSCHTLDPTNPADEPAISVSNDQVASGQTTQLTGILVLSGWASPANPNGDSAFARNVWFWIGDYQSNGFTTASVSGPGVIDDRQATGDISSGWFFPIDGVTHPDCSDPRATDAERSRCLHQADR